MGLEWSSHGYPGEGACPGLCTFLGGQELDNRQSTSKLVSPGNPRVNLTDLTKQKIGAGEMAQGLRALTTLEEDLGFIPSTHVAAPNHS